jgi:hypothetical protein
MPLAQVGRPVRGHGAEAQPVGVHPLDVDGRQRSLELGGNEQSELLLSAQPNQTARIMTRAC